MGVYQLICPNVDCLLRKMNYIGSTTTTLSMRLTMHLTNGAIREHQIGTHHSNLAGEHIVNNTSILRKQNDINRLVINEAILIKLEKPEINCQDTGISRTLKLFSENVIPQNILQLPDRNLLKLPMEII